MDLDPSLSPIAWAAAAAAASTLFAIIVLVTAVRRRRKNPLAPGVDLRIDVSRLPGGGPPGDGPRLEFYGMPVRLVALVLAPAGRNSSLPPTEKLPGILDSLVPGLASVLPYHRPMLCEWPSQLSTQGFTHAFFNNVPLPGDRGKGTPWCSAAGRFDAGDQQLLAGVLCAAHKPNSLSQVPVANVGQWLEVLRVKGG